MPLQNSVQAKDSIDRSENEGWNAVGTASINLGVHKMGILSVKPNKIKQILPGVPPQT